MLRISSSENISFFSEKKEKTGPLTNVYQHRRSNSSPLNGLRKKSYYTVYWPFSTPVTPLDTPKSESRSRSPALDASFRDIDIKDMRRDALRELQKLLAQWQDTSKKLESSGVDAPEVLFALHSFLSWLSRMVDEINTMQKSVIVHISDTAGEKNSLLQESVTSTFALRR